MRAIAIDELCNELRKAREKRVVLTFHTIGDRDGVGSAVALSQFFPNSTVVTPDFLTSNAKRMLSYIGYGSKVTGMFPDDAEVIIALDTNNPIALGKLGSKLETSKVAVIFIDHHAPHKELQPNALMYNDEGHNSTASIIYDVMKKLGMQIDRNSAILLLNGITADSADMQNSTPATFRQVADLLEISKLDFSFFSEYFHENIPVENRYEVINEIKSAKTEVVGKYIVIYGQAREHANVAADTALKLEADASVFWVASSAEASISARLRSPLDKELSLHLGIMMEEIGKIVNGNGGGHACAAGAYGPKISAAREAGEETARRIMLKMKESQKP